LFFHLFIPAIGSSTFFGEEGGFSWKEPGVYQILLGLGLLLVGIVFVKDN
jgi:hypothetical protein